MNFRKLKKGKGKFAAFKPAKKSRTGHKGKGQIFGKPKSKKATLDADQEVPLKPTGDAPASNRADMELTRMLGKNKS